MGWSIKPAGSWGIATSNAPATDVATALALPGSWKLDQYPQGATPTQRLYVRKDQWGTLTATPEVDSIAPTGGPVAGGTGVTIRGSGLTGSTGVTFGGTAATGFLVNSDATVTCITPAHAAGAVPVVVLNPRGNVTAAEQFTFV
ncbi:MAG TPA: IPT/TIG domain-containing protein [Acidimicrobiales bacterium]